MLRSDRLNVFGFLGGREVQQRSSRSTSGNFGIEDQRLAMTWTREHIAAFGGNPEDVTIFGESAGGNSVINHLAQEASFGLYTKAVVESGAYNLGARNMSAAQAGFVGLLGSAQCSDLDCLLAADATAIESAGGAGTGGWGPVVDGVSLKAAPIELIHAKQYNNKVPVIIGSNRDEEAFFTVLEKVPPQLSEVAMNAMLARKTSAANIATLKKLYDPAGGYPYPSDLGAYSKWYWMYMRIGTDKVPGLGPCAVRWLDRMLLAGGTPAVYSYLYAHPDQEQFVPGTGPGGVFVPHASEIVAVFNTPNLRNPEEGHL